MQGLYTDLGLYKNTTYDVSLLEAFEAQKRLKSPGVTVYFTFKAFGRRNFLERLTQLTFF